MWGQAQEFGSSGRGGHLKGNQQDEYLEYVGRWVISFPNEFLTG